MKHNFISKYWHLTHKRNEIPQNAQLQVIIIKKYCIPVTTQQNHTKDNFIFTRIFNNNAIKWFNER